MRLVAWNANYNNHPKRSFDDNVALLNVFHPDVVVLSESAPPLASSPRAVPLGVGRPALVVAAHGAYSLEPSELNAGAPSQSGLFALRGPTNFALAAVWPVQSEGGPSYQRSLSQILGRFRSGLERGPAVVAGDFNSSARVKAQSASHPKFVSAMKAVGLKSVYHYHAGVDHGDEGVATFTRGKSRPQRFHLDYCFVSSSLVQASTVTIPQAEAWLSQSDHFPLVVDIPDAALRAYAP